MTTDKKLILVFSLSILLFPALSLVLQAQDTPPATGKPPVPRLTSAPNMCAWTAQYQYKKADPYPKASNPIDAEIYERMRKAYPRLETVRVTKAGNKRKKVEHYADGSETITWIAGDILSMDRRVTHILSTGNSKQAGTNLEDDFYELDWVNKAEYKGHQNFQGIDCYAYHMNQTSDSLEQTAYINVKTGLPQAIETPDAIIAYSFTASSDPIEMPKDVVERIHAVQSPPVQKPF